MRKFQKTGILLLAILLLSSCALRSVDGEDGSAAPGTTGAPPVETTDAATATDPPETDPPVTQTRTASFLGCGDNIIYYGTYRDAASQAYSGGRQYNFSPLYARVKDTISAADIAFINQETPVSQSNAPEDYPTFNSPVDLTYDVVDAGFDVINLATNHMLDQGPLGVKESFENWNARDVTVIGCYEEREDNHYITYYEKNGIKIAFLSYTYGTNLGGDPADYGLYASYLKYADLEGEIREARENADFVIASAHWGDEYSLTPSDEQEEYAKKMAQYGVDVIIGHHPHVLQPIVEIPREDGGSTLCIYSLGNFVHEQHLYINAVGGMITFDIVQENGGHATYENVQLIPTVCHYPRSFYGNTVYFLKDYTEELCNQHAVRTWYNNPMQFSDLFALVKNTIDSKYLPEYMK